MQEILLNRKTLKCAFGIYIFLLVWVLLFKCCSYLLFETIEYNLLFSFEKRFFSKLLIPFYAIYQFISFKDFEEIIFLIFDVILYIPMGIFISYFCDKRKTLIWIFISILIIEVVQPIFLIGGLDSTDIITNFLGGILGVWLYGKYVKKISNNTINKICKYIVVFGGLLCIFALIFSVVNIINYL